MSYFAEIRYSEVSVTPKKYFGDFVLLLRIPYFEPSLLWWPVGSLLNPGGMEEG